MWGNLTGKCLFDFRPLAILDGLLCDQRGRGIVTHPKWLTQCVPALRFSWFGYLIVCLAPLSILGWLWQLSLGDFLGWLSWVIFYHTDSDFGSDWEFGFGSDWTSIHDSWRRFRQIWTSISTDLWRQFLRFNFMVRFNSILAAPYSGGLSTDCRSEYWL